MHHAAKPNGGFSLSTVPTANTSRADYHAFVADRLLAFAARYARGLLLMFGAVEDAFLARDWDARRARDEFRSALPAKLVLVRILRTALAAPLHEN